MISVNFASRDRLVDVPGMLSFAASRRLAYIANFTDRCPEMAPSGWHLYVGTSVPKPSIGDFDESAETELLLEDLRDNIDGFDERARILNVAVTRDDWPRNVRWRVSICRTTPRSPACGTSVTGSRSMPMGAPRHAPRRLRW